MKTTRQERCRELVGLVVVLTRRVETKNGIFMPGLMYRIGGTWRGRFTLIELGRAGEVRLRNVSRRSFQVL